MTATGQSLMAADGQILVAADRPVGNSVRTHVDRVRGIAGFAADYEGCGSLGFLQFGGSGRRGSSGSRVRTGLWKGRS
jgi:hypothetical protein